MSLITNRFAAGGCALLALAAATLFNSASAATISYPDQGPVAGYTFSNMFESTATDVPPLYGAPTAFPIGLSFTPTAAFVANSALGGSDLTDGQFNFKVDTSSAAGIPLVTLNETGDYSLTGVGPGTTAAAGASMRVTVTEINNVPVSPISLAQAASSVTFSLPGNLGVGVWSLNVTVDVNAQLASLGFAPNQIATRADVVIDNALIAISTLTSTARIDKNTFGITILPEPNSMLLAGLALCGMGFVARRRA